MALLEKRKERTRIIQETDNDVDIANRIVTQSLDGEIVSALEIASPGNKHLRVNFKEFPDNSLLYLRSPVSLFVIDLFPPTPRDPQEIHAAIWDELGKTPKLAPPGLNLAVMSYDACSVITA